MKYDLNDKLDIFKCLMLMASNFTEDYTHILKAKNQKVFSNYQDAYFASSNKEDDFYEQMPTTLEKQIELLHKSPYDFFNQSNYKKALTKIGIEDAPLLENWELNYLHEEYLEIVKDELEDEDRETRGFKQVLAWCRRNKNEFIGQQNYEIVRQFIFDNRFGFSSKKHFEEEMKKLGIGEPLTTYLETATETYNANNHFHCSYCGKPISKNQKDILTCIHYRCRDFNLRNIKNLQSVKNKKVFWSRAYYRSVIIPTFLELEIDEEVQKTLPMASIILFPGIERDGDRLISLGEKDLLIDAKDYKHKNHLFAFLNSERGSKIRPGTLIVTNNQMVGILKDKALKEKGIEVIRLSDLSKYLKKYFKFEQKEFEI